jgi:hypothetical protein
MLLVSSDAKSALLVYRARYVFFKDGSLLFPVTESQTEVFVCCLRLLTEEKASEYLEA